MLIISVACAFGCAKIAERKNRGVGLWGVLGFVLGLIGLVIVAVLPAADGKRAGNTP